MYAHYFPFFCFFLLIYTPYSYHATKRGGTAPPRFVSFPFLTTSCSNSYPPLPRSNAMCFTANGEGSTPSPFVFVHFDANREGSTPLPVVLHHHPQERANTLVLEGGGCTRALTLAPPMSTTLENEQTHSFSVAVVVVQAHCPPPPMKMSIRACFHWQLFSRPTTVPHHPRKRAYMLVFVGGGCSPSKQDETPSVGVLLCSSPSHAQ